MSAEINDVLLADNRHSSKSMATVLYQPRHRADQIKTKTVSLRILSRLTTFFFTKIAMRNLLLLPEQREIARLKHGK